jgi:hypothetical protein
LGDSVYQGLRAGRGGFGGWTSRRKLEKGGQPIEVGIWLEWASSRLLLDSDARTSREDG